LVELFAKYKPEYVNPEIIAKYLGGTLPEMKLDHPEGVVSLDSPFYIERPRGCFLRLSFLYRTSSN